MPIDRIQSVYAPVRDMDRMQAFYEQALGLPFAFRDRAAWCQFRIGQTAFALSSPAEAAVGARGNVVVFRATDASAFMQRIPELGGEYLADRDMGSHGRVITFADPEANLFQLYLSAEGSMRSPD